VQQLHDRIDFVEVLEKHGLIDSSVRRSGKMWEIKGNTENSSSDLEIVENCRKLVFPTVNYEKN